MSPASWLGISILLFVFGGATLMTGIERAEHWSADGVSVLQRLLGAIMVAGCIWAFFHGEMKARELQDATGEPVPQMEGGAS